MDDITYWKNLASMAYRRLIEQNNGIAAAVIKNGTATFEMDFMIQKGKNVVPVEVKAEVNQRAKSLKAYCQKYAPAYAVRISMKDYREEEWMTNLPLYAVSNI